MNRIIEELRRVAITTCYLYVCFGAILLYRVAVLRAHGIEYAPLGLAAIKALVLGKFIIIGRATRIGDRYKHRPLVYPVLHQSLLFLFLLVVLSFAEELTKGYLHGGTFLETVSDFGGWGQIAATALLLWLVLLPYLACIRLAEVLGPERLRQIAWGRES